LEAVSSIFAAVLSSASFFSPGTVYCVSQSLKTARALAPSKLRRTASIACSAARSP
jgi:hypothetical protein